MQKSFSTPGPASLFVELGSGDLIVHTDHTSETVVEVTGKNADDVVVEQRGDDIMVIAKQRGGGFFGSGQQLTIHVTAPHDSGLSTKLGSADVRVIGRLGETLLKSGSGDVTIDEIGADAIIETGSGDVAVDVSEGPLQVKTGSGDVTVERTGGPATISTGSGDVIVTTCDQPIQVRSGSGDIQVREAHRDASLATASGDVAVGVVHRGEVTTKNVSGDIRVGVPGGVPVWTDVSTVTGSVRSSLEGAGEPTEGQEFIELRAKTVSGDIILEQL